LATLQRVVLKIVSGNFDDQVDMIRNDEIGALSKAFGGMVKQWKTNLAATEEYERLLAEREAKFVKTEERLKAEIAEQQHVMKLEVERAKLVAVTLEKISEVVNPQPGDLNRLVKNAMKLICGVFSADVAFLGRLSHEGKVLPSSHFWVSDHFDQQYFLKTVQAETYSVLASNLLREGSLVWENLAESPISPEKNHKQANMGIKASVIVMLDADETSMNTIGIGCFRAEKAWPENIVDYLRVMGKALHGALGRWRMEAALQDSEKRFRMIVEQAGEGFFIFDYEGRILDVNRQACHMLGYSREELVEASISDMDIEVEKEGHKERYWKPLGLGDYTTFESHHQRKDGKTFPVEVRLGRVNIGEDRLLLALARNIADRKQEEHKLVESEGRYRSLVDASPSAIMAIQDQRFIFVNPAGVELLGFREPDDLIGRDVLDVVAPTSLGVVRRRFRNFSDEKMFPPIELELLRNDGTSVIVEAASVPMELHGKPTIMMIGQDITGRKRAETRLQESEKRFRMIVEQAGEGFFVLDYEGRILDVNRQTCYMLGYSRNELLKASISDVDTEVEKKGHKERYWESLGPGNYTTFESHHQRKDGKTFPVEVRLGRVDIGEDRVLLALARNIADRKQKETELKKAFEKIMELKDQLEQENIHLRKEIELEYRHEAIVGKSDAIREILRQAEQVAGSDACVLILGETGTGKELLAHAIHNMSPRKGRVMIKVNCAALPASLIESELFGREKGAYTGALTKQIGRFEAANGSTIFLDEIGDLPMEMQVKLLRVLQDGQFERLGSTETIFADVRIIAATNRNLSDLVREGRFRKDLYYRINVFPITIPPLRERREDIPLLIGMFIKELGLKRGKSIDTMPKRTMDLLQSYSWPGNIRELRNVIERAMILSTGSKLRVDRLYSGEDMDTPQMGLDEINRIHIKKVLENNGWRIYGEKGAAKILQLKPSTLQYKIKKLNIEKPVLG